MFLKCLCVKSCVGANDYLKISDGFQNMIFCGSPNYPRLLFESRSNWVTIESATTTSAITSLFKGGFQVYIEGFRVQILFSSSSFFYKSRIFNILFICIALKLKKRWFRQLHYFPLVRGKQLLDHRFALVNLNF